jgi:predicted PurR-regulated permease PerM
MENQEVKDALSQHIVKGELALRDALTGMESTYNTTLWWGPAHDALNNYMNHSTPLAGKEVPWNEVSSHESVTVTLKQFFQGIDAEHLSLWQMVQFFRTKLESWNISPSDIFVAMGHARWGGSKMANISLRMVQGMLVALAFLLSMGFKTILFFSVLWYVLSQESLIERFVRDLLPIPQDQKNDAVRNLRQSIEGVFFSIPAIACFHGIITLASFTVLSIEFPFFSTFLSVIFSLLPVVDPYLVCLPWVFACIIGGESTKGISLFILQYVVSRFVAKRIIITGVPQCGEFLTYLTVLSIFMGFAAFGFQGVFAGPLVVVLGRLVFLSLDALTSSSEVSWPEIIMRYPLRSRNSQLRSTVDVDG